MKLNKFYIILPFTLAVMIDSKNVSLIYKSDWRPVEILMFLVLQGQFGSFCGKLTFLYVYLKLLGRKTSYTLEKEILSSAAPFPLIPLKAKLWSSRHKLMWAMALNYWWISVLMFLCVWESNVDNAMHYSKLHAMFLPSVIIAGIVTEKLWHVQLRSGKSYASSMWLALAAYSVVSFAPEIIFEITSNELLCIIILFSSGAILLGLMLSGWRATKNHNSSPASGQRAS